ncbi:hypothetical protein CRENBAI_012435 [Crenichthys baileyi]|uniref:ZP domain-containing protein n=1 Tax=Crenichthys baileyi TaxID=28760 RepID=A0AAV9RU01_9TELE
MNPFLCLPLLAVLLQPALCIYNCSSVYERTPDNSDLTVQCGTTMITIELNLCTAQWAGFNSSTLALNGNHINPACLGSVDESVNPPILRYHLPVNNSMDNSCRQSLQIVDEVPDPAGPFSSFSNIQSVIITSYIDTPKSDAGIISYSTDLYYYFSCRYPLEYLINNTEIVAFNVLLDHCFATPSPYNMTQKDQYNFFAGCKVSTRTSVTRNGLSNVAWFNFEAFRFVQHKDQEKSSIYLHCILRLCEPSKCQVLLSACDARRKRSLTPYGGESSDSATISVGPLYTAKQGNTVTSASAGVDATSLGVWLMFGSVAVLVPDMVAGLS